MTPMQQLFVDNYITCWNGTKAAIAAGYSPKTAVVQASRLLSNANILAEVNARLKQSAMQADEVLARLTQHARADLGDFLTDDNGIELKDRPTHLIKKIKHKKTRRSYEDVDIDEVTVDLELYDAQAALNTLAKFHKLVDRLDPRPPEPARRPDLSRLSLDELKQYEALTAKVGSSV